MTTRYFIESDFDSPQRARQARDELAQHLTTKGLTYRSRTASGGHTYQTQTPSNPE